jgi:nitric oxide synthase-interacting protein
MMTQEVARQLAYPTMTCPVTGKKFKMDDVIELARASSGYSSSGKVEATVYRPSMT